MVAVGRFLVHPGHAHQCLPMRACRRGASSATCGVCAIAAGLTFLETIANPYTTVLGPRATPPRASTSRSPATASAGSSARSSAACSFIPRTPHGTQHRQRDALHSLRHRGGGGRACSRSSSTSPTSRTSRPRMTITSMIRRRGVSHSIWTHPHFVLAVAAQFLYVAAQAGIFSFFINYMTAEVPPFRRPGRTGIATEVDRGADNLDPGRLQEFAGVRRQVETEAGPGFRLSEQRVVRPDTATALADYKGAALRCQTAATRPGSRPEQDRQTGPRPRSKEKQLLYDAQRFGGIALGATHPSRLLADKGAE